VGVTSLGALSERTFQQAIFRRAVVGWWPGCAYLLERKPGSNGLHVGVKSTICQWVRWNAWCDGRNDRRLPCSSQAGL